MTICTRGKISRRSSSRFNIGGYKLTHLKNKVISGSNLFLAFNDDHRNFGNCSAKLGGGQATADRWTHFFIAFSLESQRCYPIYRFCGFKSYFKYFQTSLVNRNPSSADQDDLFFGPRPSFQMGPCQWSGNMINCSLWDRKTDIVTGKRICLKCQKTWQRFCHCLVHQAQKLL